MRIVDSSDYGYKKIDKIGGWRKSPHARSVVDILSECRSLDVVHHHVGNRVTLLRSGMEIVYLYNIRVTERRNGLCFTQKARHKIGVRSQVGMQNFNCDKTLQLCIESLPNLSHTAAPQTLAQFVFPVSGTVTFAFTRSRFCTHRRLSFLLGLLCKRRNIKRCKLLDTVVNLYCPRLYLVSRWIKPPNNGIICPRLHIRQRSLCQRLLEQLPSKLHVCL